MIDLVAYDLRPLAGELSRLRQAWDFSERQALIENVGPAEASQAGAMRRRAMPSVAGVGSPTTLPSSGPAAPAPGPRSLAEEEWALDKAAAVKGGGSSSARSGARVVSAGGRSGASHGGATGSAGSASRSPLAAKAGLASGAQAAVVKLASYGSGAARAGALLNYQSHKGELSLEREDGSLVTGKEAIGDLAAHWRNDDERGPSNDVFSVSMRFDGSVREEDIRHGLSSALAGHKYAWRVETDGDGAMAHLVAVAAGSRRDDRGKLERTFANAKSEDRLFTKIETVIGRDADFSDVTWTHGVEGATTRLAALTKLGQFSAETESGLTIEAAADQLFSNKPSNVRRSKPEGFNPALELAKAWRPAMRSSAPRDFAHVIMSAKPGTDKDAFKDAFMDAARATLAREFSGHEYVFVMHTNRQHIHVHAAIRLTHPTGQKLDPNIRDFARWRETLAEEARARNIPMEAVRRFDQAHTPGYRLKDAKMVERGKAPPNVRRRVERVQNREIHRPTRDEGLRRAQVAASQWRSLAGESSRRVPASPPGALRLYRLDDGESHHGALFAADIALAASFGTTKGGARMVYVDVPASRLGELSPSRNRPGELFVVPRAISAESRPLENLPDASILHFQKRAEGALAESKPNTLPKERLPMRTAETMTTARDGMAETLSQIGALLPDEQIRAQFEQQSKRLLDKADAAIAAQSSLERQSADILGVRYVRPEPPKDVAPTITHERKGEEIHYYRRDATGALRTLAFIDKGKDLDVRDWNNRDSVDAALKLASEKWEGISINGSDTYKETAVRLAAEHGFNITNPELQDRIRALRADIEFDRAPVVEAEPSKNMAANRLQGTQNDPRKAPTAEITSGPKSTPAEQELQLQTIRGRVEREAQRETQQAAEAKAAHEFNAAQGSEQAPYRSPHEAESAREAERATDSNVHRQLPADVRQSEVMQSLRQQQTRVLNAEEEQRRVDAENAERINRELEQPRRSEAEGESR